MWLQEVAACQSLTQSSTKGPEEMELTENDKKPYRSPSLKKVIFKTFYKSYLLYGLCLLLQALTLR